MVTVIKFRFVTSGLFKLQITIRRVFLVDALCGIIYSGITSVLSIGNTIFIQMPKRALVLYWTLQKELLLLPFRILNKVYDSLVKRPAMLLLGVYRVFTKEGPAPVELLTGEKNPSSSQVMSSVLGVRKAALKTIRRETRARSQLDMYRKQLDNWRLENEKKTEEIYKLNEEERDSLKVVAQALRYWKTLKGKREKLNEGYGETVRLMLEDGSVTADKLIAMQKKIKAVDAAVKEKKDNCLDLLTNGNITNGNITNGVNPESKGSRRGQQNASRPSSDVQMPSDAIQKILALVADENAYLKDKISSSQDTLERILQISGGINDRIALLSEKITLMANLNPGVDDLHQKLDEKKMLLKAAEEDRDLMKEKLLTLESMIKEEESFLGEMHMESAFDDSDYSSFPGGCEEKLAVG